MELAEYITGFMEMVADDPRIGPCHISLFLAILHFYQMQNCHNPVSVFSGELRKQAKIGSMRVYFNCMKNLREWGYVKYLPSYNPAKASSIFLVKV